LIQSIKLGNTTFQQLPASQVLPGMLLITYDNGIVSEDVVIRKTIINKKDYVYDINVDNTHNLIVNDIFTHNSIYSFSGANCDMIEDLLTKERKTQRLTLSKNFRSDKTIVEHSNQFSKIKAIPNSENDGSVHYKLIDTYTFLRMIEDDKPLTILARSNKAIKEIEKFCLQKKLKMKYFNFLSPTDIEHIKKDQINGSIKMRLDKVVTYFGSRTKLIEFIEENQDSEKFITSIHKSKGREFPRCIIVNSIDPALAKKHKIDPKYTYETKDGDIDQEEKNIHYVAVTRPKHEVYFMVFD
jgi:superfamily I DNA/RNA helicase